MLDGRAAIITGAGRGIGRGFAIAMAREGASVVVASRTPSTVEEVTGVIRGEGGRASPFVCDVGERDQLKALADAAVKAFGTVDILVNNAQGFGTPDNPVGTMPHSPVETITFEEMEYTHRTGFYATLWLMQYCFPHMKAQGRGRIINIGSRSGQRGNEFVACYNSNKEAIRGLSRTAAREWARYGITVNVINPLLESNSLETLRHRSPETAQRIADRIATLPMGRYGDPIEDGAPLAVFLASDASRYVSGQTIMLDGSDYTYA